MLVYSLTLSDNQAWKLVCPCLWRFVGKCLALRALLSLKLLLVMVIWTLPFETALIRRRLLWLYLQLLLYCLHRLGNGHRVVVEVAFTLIPLSELKVLLVIWINWNPVIFLKVSWIDVHGLHIHTWHLVVHLLSGRLKSKLIELFVVLSPHLDYSTVRCVCRIHVVLRSIVMVWLLDLRAQLQLTHHVLSCRYLDRVLSNCRLVGVEKFTLGLVGLG